MNPADTPSTSNKLNIKSRIGSVKRDLSRLNLMGKKEFIGKFFVYLFGASIFVCIIGFAENSTPISSSCKVYIGEFIQI